MISFSWQCYRLRAAGEQVRKKTLSNGYTANTVARLFHSLIANGNSHMCKLTTWTQSTKYHELHGLVQVVRHICAILFRWLSNWNEYLLGLRHSHSLFISKTTQTTWTTRTKPDIKKHFDVQVMCKILKTCGLVLNPPFTTGMPASIFLI